MQSVYGLSILENYKKNWKSISKIFTYVDDRGFLKIIYSEGRERETDSAQVGGGAEGPGEGKNLQQILSECDGTWSHAPKIMTWAETKSHTLNQLSHPGCPYVNDISSILNIFNSPC